jgi:hypothetical protein
MSDNLAHQGNFKYSVGLAVIGGMSKWFLVQAPTFSTRFVEAVITAFGCGIVGALGKLLVDWLKVKFFKMKA